MHNKAVENGRFGSVRVGGVVLMGAGQTGGAAAAYAGDVSAKEAWSKLASDSRAVLVDVRSDAEWTFVGLPDLSSLGKRPVLVPLQVFPGMKPNPNFTAEVVQAIPAEDVPVYFISRRGARSRSAEWAGAAGRGSRSRRACEGRATPSTTSCR